MNNKKEFKVFSAVDPEYLKKVSEMLKRQLTSDKDTANYNSQVISNLIDKTSIALRDSGQREIQPGDAMKISEEIDAIIQKRAVNEEVFDLKMEVNYDLDHASPFSYKLEQEQRTKHILRTEALDTFESLMDELDVYMPRFVSMENWLKLKMAISKGNDRLATNNLIFLGPEVFLGKEMKLSTKEMERLGFSLETGNLSYDLRPNGPDLLAMKELVRVLKGGTMEDLSFAPGFFAKYTHELVQSKILSVIFKTVNNKLSSIEIFDITNKTAESELFADNRNTSERFTPAKALCLLTRKLLEGSNNDEDDQKTLVSLKDNEKYYFVFHGYISSPNENNHFGYEKNPPLNEKLVTSGEVFVIKKVKNKILTTRIYFVPEDYSHFHPYHQHGSVIFGNNDYSYQSSAESIESMYRNLFLKEMYVKNLTAIYEPSFIFGLVKKFPGITDPEHYFKLYEYREFNNALMNRYEESPLVFDFLIKGKMPTYFYNHPVGKISEEESQMLDKRESYAVAFAMKHLVKNYAPLHKKWKLRQYLMDGSGIVEERVPGIIDNLATEAKGNEAMRLTAEMVKRAEKKK